jgi:hypothetical protein
MNTLQVIVKTIATTIDLLVMAVVVLDKRNPEFAKRAIAVISFINLMGVWV